MKIGKTMLNNFSSNLLGFYTNRASSIEQLELPNILYKNAIDEANKDIAKLNTYYEGSAKSVGNNNVIGQLIKLSRVKNINESDNYTRVCSQHAMERCGILGIITPMDVGTPYNANFTSSLNFDIVIGYSDFTSDEILKCHSHPWDNVDLRIPDGSWQTKGSVTLWSINVVGLFKSYFKYRNIMSINSFVFKHVLVKAIPSITQHSLLNRKGNVCNNIDTDTAPSYNHQRNIGSSLQTLDKYTAKIISVSMEATIQAFPSLDLGGQLKGLQLPTIYKTSDMQRILMYGILNRTLAIQRSLNKTSISVNSSYTKRYLRKIKLTLEQEQVIPDEFIPGIKLLYNYIKETLR